MPDVTVAYKAEPLPIDLIEHRDIGKSLYYTLAIDNGRVTKMYMNSSEPGMQNISMNIYIIDRELLISQINTAMCADRYTLSAISWRPS